MNKKIINKNITIEQFIEEITKLRELGDEYMFQGIVNEKMVALQGTGTYNKWFVVDGTKHGGSRDIGIDQWVHELRRGVTSR